MKTPDRSLKAYWFGYVYAAFWAYVTYSCFTHLLWVILKFNSDVSGSSQAAVAEKWTSAVLWPAGTVIFGWMTYRLIAQKVGMPTIYALVAIHGLNILMRGIIPRELVFYISLSAIVVTNFKRRFAPTSSPLL
jgi:hypothetical protein